MSIKLVYPEMADQDTSFCTLALLLLLSCPFLLMSKKEVKLKSAPFPVGIQLCSKDLAEKKVETIGDYGQPLSKIVKEAVLASVTLQYHSPSSLVSSSSLVPFCISLPVPHSCPIPPHLPTLISFSE